MKLQRILIVVGFCWALLACGANQKDNFYDQVVLSQKKLLVLPSTSLHRQIRFLNRDVQAALVKQLTVQQLNVQAVSEADFKAARSQALDSSGSIYEPSLKDYVPLYPNKYFPALLQALAQNYQFDTAIVPELVLRTALVDGKQISWDEKEATIEYSAEMELAQVRALSLKLDFFQANGLGLGQRFAGYVMPFDIVGKRIPEFELRTDLYQQFDALNAAVAIALSGAGSVKTNKGANNDE